MEQLTENLPTWALLIIITIKLSYDAFRRFSKDKDDTTVEVVAAAVKTKDGKTGSSYHQLKLDDALARHASQERAQRTERLLERLVDTSERQQDLLERMEKRSYEQEQEVREINLKVDRLLTLRPPPLSSVRTPIAGDRVDVVQG